MKYSVDSVKITLTEDETLVAGSVGVHYAEFTFDKSWDEYAKTAVFRNGNITVEALVADGRCEIPWEVLAEGGLLYVGIRGELGDKQRPTLWAARKTVHEGAEHGDEAREPTPDIYQQLLKEIADIEEGKTPELRCAGKTVYWKYTHESEGAWRELVTVVDGKDGAEGAQGLQGPQGVQGIQGEKGEKGDTGAQGAKGEQGVPGPPGKDGVSGVYVGSGDMPDGYNIQIDLEGDPTMSKFQNCIVYFNDAGEMATLRLGAGLKIENGELISVGSATWDNTTSVIGDGVIGNMVIGV